MSEKKEDCVNCGDQQLPPDGSIPTPNFPSFMDAPWEDPKNEREENWRLLTILNIPCLSLLPIASANGFILSCKSPKTFLNGPGLNPCKSVLNIFCKD